MKIAALTMSMLLCLGLCACEDDYTAAARATVAERGIERADELLLANAQRGAGRDIYVYQRFLLMYGASLPATRPYDDDDAEAFLNCAASAGVKEAVDFGQGHLTALRDNAGALQAAQCISTRRERRSSDADTWAACGGVSILPACPIPANDRRN